MSTITKQWLKQKIADMEAARDEIPFGLDEDDSNTLAALRIALTSLEVEPYGYVHKAAYEQAGSCGLSSDHEAYRDSSTHIAVYAAPPAPVSVPAAMEMDDDFDSAFEHGKAVGWNAYRAAMLQGSDGTLTNEGTITATQFKPVADLYGLTSPTGSETSFTFDAVEARDFVDGGWSCQEYVELERFQEAVSGNSPVIPDGWVACSERMPSPNQYVLVCNGVWVGMGMHNDSEHLEDDERWQDEHHEFIDLLHHPVTHWMPLPAAPQQEVRP
ncbi:DUF551 domain-containing protein [Enterobacter asburiae]|uniref:DUF551 domain-containing protein n=1 Tax=Enterobacter asburiae TaxID=61645 RepID=UPI0029347B40|nr:DUF551 domain-containing protein [Enterobacter asburiae]